LRALLAVGSGRPSDAALSHALGMVPAAARGLTTELVYGTLRWSLRLDHTLAVYVKRPLSVTPSPALWALRLGAYQLLLLGTPAHAAVAETVAAVKVVAAREAPFVNAVLHRVAGEGEVPLPADPVAALAVRGALPLWLVRRWWYRFGAERTEAIVAAETVRPPLVLRTNTARSDRQALLARLAAAGIEARPTPRSPLGVMLAPTPVAAIPGFQEGLFQVQGEASQLATLAVEAAPGAAVADVCAGMGTKSLALVARPERFRVQAFDLSAERLAKMDKEAERLGLTPPARRVIDARRPPPDLEGRFDAVLVDAPCTALGLLARHPEIRLRRVEQDIQRQATEELAILAGASLLVAPGGALVYSVCTFEREETSGVVTRFLAAHRDFTKDRGFGEDGEETILPEAGQEGFYMARLVRSA
jgi:16S rRNA (cytosine967-C5)-methyltransferase